MLKVTLANTPPRTVAPSGNGLSGAVGAAMTVSFTLTEGGGGMIAVKLYPNPAVTEIAVEMVDTKKEMKISSIEVHDMQGRLIKSYEYSEIAKSGNLKIPTSTLLKGIYFMTVYGDKGEVERKSFIVNK